MFAQIMQSRRARKLDRLMRHHGHINRTKALLDFHGHHAPGALKPEPKPSIEATRSVIDLTDHQDKEARA